MPKSFGFKQIQKLDRKKYLNIYDIGGEFRKVGEWELNLKKELFFNNTQQTPSCNEAYINKQFVVMVFNRVIEYMNWKGEVRHLAIKPIDSKPIRNHWSTIQIIKNLVCGENCNAIEIYPKQQNLVDEANLYHIWVFPESVEFKFGLENPGWFNFNNL